MTISYLIDGLSSFYTSYISSQNSENQKLEDLTQAMISLSTFLSDHPKMGALLEKSETGFQISDLSHIKQLMSQIESLPFHKDLLKILKLGQKYEKLLNEYFYHLDRFAQNEFKGVTTAEKLENLMDESDGSPKSLARIEYLKFALEKEGLGSLAKSEKVETEEGSYVQFKQAEDEYLLAIKLNELFPSPEAKLQMEVKGQVMLKAKQNYTKIAIDELKKTGLSITKLYKLYSQPKTLDLVSQGRLELVSPRMASINKVAKIMEKSFPLFFSSYKRKRRFLNLQVSNGNQSSLWKKGIVSSNKPLVSLKERYMNLAQEFEQQMVRKPEDIDKRLNILYGKFKQLEPEYQSLTSQPVSKGRIEISQSRRLDAGKVVSKGKAKVVDVAEETRLRSEYQKLKIAHPYLKNQSGETIGYDRLSNTLIVQGNGYKVFVGDTAREMVKTDFEKSILKEGQKDLPGYLSKAFIPSKIDGYIKWEKDEGLDSFDMEGGASTSNAASGSTRREILLLKEQKGTIVQVGEKGYQDLEKLQMIAKTSIVYSMRDNVIEFEGDGIRFGIWLDKDLNKMMLEKKVHWAIRKGVMFLKNRFYPKGVYATMNLHQIGKKKGKDGSTKIATTLTLNKEIQNSIEFTLGEQASDTLLNYVPALGLPLSFDLEKFKDTFLNGNGVQWEDHLKKV